MATPHIRGRALFLEPLETLTCDTFAACLGERFRIAAQAGNIELVLIEAVALGSGSRARQQKSAHRDQFSIVFRGPMSPVLPQSIYRLEHEAHGALEIFIVPIGPDQEGIRYEAIFT